MTIVAKQVDLISIQISGSKTMVQGFSRIETFTLVRNALESGISFEGLRLHLQADGRAEASSC